MKKLLSIVLLGVSFSSFAMKVDIEMDAEIKALLYKTVVKAEYASTIEKRGCWIFERFSIYPNPHAKVFNATKKVSLTPLDFADNLTKCKSELFWLTISSRQNKPKVQEYTNVPAAERMKELDFRIGSSGILNPELILKCYISDSYSVGGDRSFPTSRSKLDCKYDECTGIHPDSDTVKIKMILE